MRRWTTPIIAVTVALVGTVVLARYVQTAESRALAGEELVPVLVVAGDVSAGTAAADMADLVRREQVPRKLVPSGAVRSLDELGERVALVDLVVGEPLTSHRFATSDAVPVVVDPGLLEVSLSLAPDRAAGGQATAGGRVGVLASFPGDGVEGPRTELVLDDVLVLRAGGAAETGDGVMGGSTTTPLADTSRPILVTLALTADDAETLVYAVEHGTIWLASRPDGDAPMTTVGSPR